MNLRYPDIIVTGVGRTGTSYVSRILQTHFGVTMAVNWDYEPHNPEGSYEEQSMIKHSYAIFEKPGYTTNDWLTHYDKTFRNIPGLVGIKQTALSMCSFDQWEALAPKLVIRTWRSDLLAVESMMKWRIPKGEPSRVHWEKFYWEREHCMMQNLDFGHSFHVGMVFFGSKKLEDKKMIQWLEYHMKKAGL